LRLPFRHIGAAHRILRRSANRQRRLLAQTTHRAITTNQYWRFTETPYNFFEPRFQMTTANKITVVRILMIPAFVTMAIYYGQSIQRGAPLEWQRYAAIIIFLVAAISDGLDGYVARHYNQRSALGVILDPIADKGLLLSGIITLSITNWSELDPDYGRFPAWFPVLVITRDAVILVGAVVLHLLNGKVEVKTNWTGKVATVCQMCAIAWVMLQLHFLPLLFVVICAGAFTLASGVIYVMYGVRQLQAEGHAHAKRD
jgi:cardiolipin synthase